MEGRVRESKEEGTGKRSKDGGRKAGRNRGEHGRKEGIKREDGRGKK